MFGGARRVVDGCRVEQAVRRLAWRKGVCELAIELDPASLIDRFGSTIRTSSTGNPRHTGPAILH